MPKRQNKHWGSNLRKVYQKFKKNNSNFNLFIKKRAFSGQDPIKSWGISAGGNGGVNSKYVGESGIFSSHSKIIKLKKFIFFILYRHTNLL